MVGEDEDRRLRTLVDASRFEATIAGGRLAGAASISLNGFILTFTVPMSPPVPSFLTCTQL
jgi:hypothetical protein